MSAINNGKKRNGDGTFGEGGGPGRPAGVPNKTTGVLKEAILIAASNTGDKFAAKRMQQALERDGEIIDANGGLVGYLEAIAESYPQQFVPLLGKVLPLILTSPEADQHRAAIQARAEKFTQAMLQLMDRVDQGRAN